MEAALKTAPTLITDKKLEPFTHLRLDGFELLANTTRHIAHQVGQVDQAFQAAHAYQASYASQTDRVLSQSLALIVLEESARAHHTELSSLAEPADSVAPAVPADDDTILRARDDIEMGPRARLI